MKKMSTTVSKSTQLGLLSIAVIFRFSLASFPNRTISSPDILEDVELVDIVSGTDGIKTTINTFPNTTLEKGDTHSFGRQIVFSDGGGYISHGTKAYRKNYGAYSGQGGYGNSEDSGGGGYINSGGSGGRGYGNSGGGGYGNHGKKGYASDTETESTYGNKGVKKYNYHPVNKYGGGPSIHSHKTINGPGYGSTEIEASLPELPEVSVSMVLCDIGDKCHNFVHCASYPDHYFRAKDRCCHFSKQSKGMCCSSTYPDTKNPHPLGNHFNPYPTDTVKVPELSEETLQTAARKGYDYLPKYKTIEVKLLELNIVVERGTPEYGHLLFFQTTPAAINLARTNFLIMKACTYLQDTYYLSREEAGVGLQGYDFGGTVFEKTCPPIPTCDTSSKYRTADGSCNNAGVPKLGQSMTPLLRLLAPDYADGIWAPRVRKDGSPLPSPRFITRSLVPDANLPDPRYTHLLAQFGQFIDHDLSHVPIFRFGDMSGIQCCSRKESEFVHPTCFPISIPPNDPVLKNQPCMNFARSMIAPRIECTFGHADQMNQLTHWLDGSQIYGSAYEQAESLREFSGGQLRITRDGIGRHLLPLDLLDQETCGGRLSEGNNGLHCFLAGDKRVNEQIGLTSIHTIWLREHNRIAIELGKINPRWDDEIVYQETRRIVIAEYQHIVYNEWLPIIVGRNYMETFGILPLYDSYYTGYDANVDPSVSNSFTTAAFRMGHTLIQGMYNLQNSGGSSSGKLNLHDIFNDPYLLREPGVIDLLNKGFLTQPIQRFDNFVTTELRDKLFQGKNAAGMDLVALNLQRGRDHGLPSYNEYRDLCRLGKARDFSDLSPIIHPRKISVLEKIYGSVEDIDLFIGGIFETPLQGALVGPTFVCIIGDQFARSKLGDRYFYDIGDQPHSFDKYQLHEIRKVSMSRILCDNSDEIRSIQPLAFHLAHGGFNPTMPCGSPSIPQLDLKAWKE